MLEYQWMITRWYYSSYIILRNLCCSSTRTRKAKLENTSEDRKMWSFRSDFVLYFNKLRLRRQLHKTLCQIYSGFCVPKIIEIGSFFERIRLWPSICRYLTRTMYMCSADISNFVAPPGMRQFWTGSDIIVKYLLSIKK